MADVQSNIKVSIDTTEALASIKNLQRQISAFHTSMAKSGASANAASAQMQQNLINSINATGKFSAQMRTIKTTTESFTNSLEKNKFSLGEYFRYAGGASKSFGRLFKSEFDTINKVARENVKDLQTQYIKMGRDASGAMKAIAVRPLSLDMNDLATKTMIASEKQALLNQLLKQGSTNLLNFGKNTQWAGRQLMVGFTIPLMAVGSAAAKTFMDMETQAIRFKKVYGDLFTPQEETKAALEGITELGRQFTKYGVAVSSTVGLAAEAAAAGFKGLDLQRQTAAATKLSILGQVESQKALETTIALQNAFSMSSEDLATNIDFLNAVENQTVLSLDDMSTAIPKAAPVIQQLGGDVKDLAFFMTAMKEGGINASEGANALKSGLASMINPTGKASAMLESFGINVKKIVVDNKGDLKKTVIDFATALNQLDPLNRAQAIEQMFGKFQFARLSTLFANVTKDGTQAARVLDLAGASIQDLASLSEKELGMTSESAMNKFKGAVENLKLSLAPVGEEFLKAVTPIAEFITKILDGFNNLGSGTKKVIVAVTAIVAGLGPILLMTFGLLANGIANIIKGFAAMKSMFNKAGQSSAILGTEVNYMTLEQRNAAAVAASLDQVHKNLAQTFTAEAASVDRLTAAYNRAITAQRSFIPTSEPMGRGIVTKRAEGKPAVVGGTGNKDSELALLMPGETVIPTKMSKKYGSLINGMIADNIPGYENGLEAMISERFLPTRKGRSQSAGERSQFRVSDSYELGHFAEVSKMSGRALREFAINESQMVRDTVESLINSVTDGLNQFFDVFTNEVTVQSYELNQALGQVGSNKTASKEMFRRESVDYSGAYNSPIISKMKEAGASTQEISQAVNQLSSAFDEGITRLGDQTTVTAEEVNRITQEAYDKVSRTNEKLRSARETMQNPGAIVNVDRTERVPVSGAYNSSAERAKVNKVVQEQAPGLFPTQAAANFMGPAAREVQIQNAVAMKELFFKLNLDARKRVEALIGDVKAMSHQVVREAQAAGIDIGEYLILGISEGTASNSDSKEAIKQGNNVVNGLVHSMQNGKDDVLLAGEQLGASAIDGINTGRKERRIATSPQGPVPIGPAAPAGTRMLPIVTAPIIDQSKNLTKSLSVSADKISSFNSGLNGLTFGLTAAAGAGTMFDGKIGELSGKVMKYSGLMFGLMQITQLLTQAQFARLVAERAATAGILQKTVIESTGAVTFSRTTGLFSGGIKKLLPNLFNFSKRLVSMLGPYGRAAAIAVTLAGAMWSLKKVADAQREKIDGLGNAAFITGERLKTLGDIFGVSPKAFAFENLPKSTGLGLATDQRTKTQQVLQSEDFQKQFGKDISAISQSTQQEAELLFRGLVVQLKQRGFDKETVQAIINAIKLESGKTDIEIDFDKITILTPEGRKAVQKDIVSMLKLATTTKAVKAAAGSLAGIIGATQSAFADGAISAQEYSDQMSFINMEIAKQPYPKGVEITNSLFASMDKTGVLGKTAAGIKNINDRLLVLNAIALAGLGPDSPLVKGLASTDLLMQDISRRGINKLLAKTIEGLVTSVADASVVTKDYQDATSGLSSSSKKAVAALNKEIKALEKKKQALQDINDEIDRQQEFQRKQQELDASIAEARISGNYIQAALLGQQKLYEQSQYNRKTAELDLDRQIKALQDRVDAIEAGGKVTALDKKIAKIEKSANEKSSKGTNTKTDKPAAKKDETTKTPTPVPTYGAESKDKVKDIPPYAPALSALLKKYNGIAGSKTVAFNPASGNWEEVKIGRIPKNYITKEMWSRGVKTYATGGYVQHFGPGGDVNGPGTGTSDSIPAMLSNGEYVIKASSVNKYGEETFDALNAGKFAKGGVIGSRIGGSGPDAFKSSRKGLGALFDKRLWEDTANFFALPEIGKTLLDMNKYGGIGPTGITGMTLARLMGKEMKSTTKDNALSMLSVLPIPAAKLLKPISKIIPKSLKNVLLKNGVGTKFLDATVSKQQNISTLPGNISKAEKEAYKKEMFEIDGFNYPTYKIGDSGDRISFAGHTENVSATASVKARAVSTTPEGLLAEAIKMNPTDLSLVSMRDNFIKFKNGDLKSIGDNERDFLTQMSAAVGIDNKGSASAIENTDGFAELLSALSGNLNSKSNIDMKKKAFIEMIEKNKAQSKAYASSPNNYIKDVTPIDPSQAPVFHATPFEVIRNKDGSVDIFPHGSHTAGKVDDKGLAGGVQRSSVHTTVESTVASNMNRLGGKNYTEIVAPLSSMIKNNGYPINGNPIDTYWSIAPGKSLHFDNPTIIRTLSDESSYIKELEARGLIKKGQQPPLSILDPKNNDILRLLKSSYTDEDRASLLRLQYADDEYIANSASYRDGLIGREEDAIKELSQQMAKKNIGIDTQYTGQTQDTLNNKYLNDQYWKWAENNGIRAGLHDGDMIHMLEKEMIRHSNYGRIGQTSSSKADYNDSLEAAQMAALHGGFKTNISQIQATTSDGFAQGGLVGYNSGKPDPKQSLLNRFLFGQKYIGGNTNIIKGEVPFGPGGLGKIASKISMKSILSKTKELAYKPANLLNQYMNYFKAKKMVKSGMYHGSADLGRNSDGPLKGITDLSGDYARDPYYGMGFYGTSSKAEADLYASGYNAPGQWGESYGSLNKITKIPFGRYLDFSKDLKKQNYGLWKMLQGKGILGAGENLGPLMNKAGMTGSIMPRISTGMAPSDIQNAMWIALNKPKGTMMTDKFAQGGMVGPKYKLPSYDVGSPYIPEDQIAQLHKGERVLTAAENKNFSSSGPITNNITINGADKNPKQIAQEVMIQLERMQSKNNKTNSVVR